MEAALSAHYLLEGQSSRPFDFIDDPQPNGTINRVPDWQRIKNIYIPRFDTKTRLRGYNIVAFVPKQNGKGADRVPEQLKYVLSLFRAIKFAAKHLASPST